jgi:hypothetical protein
MRSNRSVRQRTLTFNEILTEIQKQKPCSVVTLRRYFRQLKIRPLGTIQTRPLRYAVDTPARVLEATGVRIVTMAQLRAERAKALAARGEK